MPLRISSFAHNRREREKRPAPLSMNLLFPRFRAVIHARIRHCIDVACVIITAPASVFHRQCAVWKATAAIDRTLVVVKALTFSSTVKAAVSDCAVLSSPDNSEFFFINYLCEYFRFVKCALLHLLIPPLHDLQVSLSM